MYHQEPRRSDSRASLSGSEDGFSFTSTDATTEPAWAEFGTERNGSFLS